MGQPHDSRWCSASSMEETAFLGLGSLRCANGASNNWRLVPITPSSESKWFKRNVL